MWNSVRSSDRLFWVCRIRTLNIRARSKGGRPPFDRSARDAVRSSPSPFLDKTCQPILDVEHPDLPNHPILPVNPRRNAQRALTGRSAPGLKVTLQFSAPLQSLLNQSPPDRRASAAHSALAPMRRRSCHPAV
jgi:hypothetical protein